MNFEASLMPEASLRGTGAPSDAFGFKFRQKKPQRRGLVGGKRDAIDHPQSFADVVGQRRAARRGCRMRAFDGIPIPPGSIVAAPIPIFFIEGHHGHNILRRGWISGGNPLFPRRLYAAPRFTHQLTTQR